MSDVIRTAIAEHIERRRQDPEFMRRLRERIEADRRLLGKLANTDCADCYEGEQCARCGSSITVEPCPTCEACGYDPHTRPYPGCPVCDGTGRAAFCLSSFDWCQANPLTGRDDIERHTIETFTVPCARHPVNAKGDPR